MLKKPIKTIVWDWNGTLLNDVDLSIHSMNELLGERNLPLLSKQYYKQIFRFPVKDYYSDIGFDFDNEPFELVGTAFMDAYKLHIPNMSLFDDSLETVQQLHQKGYSQHVLSAMEQHLLFEMTQKSDLHRYMTSINGIDNHLGGGKIDLGKTFVQKLNHAPDECLLVGDTTHDAEVAATCGFQCILYSGGHYSHERLQKTGLPIIQKLSELVNLL
ncbi:MAG: HAD hydrolase-like protein [Lentimicrobiaceae bacterium]|jgi:phosphoglycolate phosphatase|nr:HAD hydrolase-like protein [Lentimicrobiaceae bacterium]